jgi:hypothetical protein
MTTTFTPAPRSGIRFPLQRILDLTRAKSCAQLAERLGVSAEAVRQWDRRGLSSAQADWVATRLGYWPGSVWDNFDADLSPDDADYGVDLSDRVVSGIADSDGPHLICCWVDAREDLPALQPRQRPLVGGKLKFPAALPITGFRPGAGRGGAR